MSLGTCMRAARPAGAMPPEGLQPAGHCVHSARLPCCRQVGNHATVLGFVGAPFTLASYIVEGGSSKNYTHIKRLAFAQPDVLHALLSVLADNIATYVRYQVRCCGPDCSGMPLPLLIRPLSLQPGSDAQAAH